MHKNASAHVADRLRRQIILRELPPGAALRQEALADALGVSRMPVRDALQRLLVEGLVTLHPNRGSPPAQRSWRIYERPSASFGTDCTKSLEREEIAMSTHQAEISWRRQAHERFTDSKYSRAHTWTFDGGAIIAASSAVSSVPLPYSHPENVDPEEGLVAAISSCHMLTFLYLAAKSGFVVDSYEDRAVGTMTADARGRRSITAVKLSPEIVFSGSLHPNDGAVSHLHHDAHEECYIANSVRSEISVAGSWRLRQG